jgi:hypothetical protein
MPLSRRMDAPAIARMSVTIELFGYSVQGEPRGGLLAMSPLDIAKLQYDYLRWDMVDTYANHIH